ncbi:MAG: DNA double-strand break repair nuclease NurA [Dehalococcoidales bacterium]|nr:DNA double-strand break repair nuclease NurA [Dehalococcoidales bacterium]
MSLDLTRVASQVGGLLERLRESLDDRGRNLRFALETAHRETEQPDKLKKKINASMTSWLTAGITEGIDFHYPCPGLPDNFTVVATDGSHIDVDRHRSARCYLINIGSVLLRYGVNPEAVLESIPNLCASEEDLVYTEPVTRRETPVEGTLLGLKRSVEECRRLAELAEIQPEGSAVQALVDGTLIQWGFSTENYPAFVVEKLLDRGYLDCLDRMNKANERRRVALASYISLPRGNDVTNALKIAVCPNNPLDADKHCKDCRTRECENLTGLRDRDVFGGILGEGERSSLFFTNSRIVRERYREHAIYFYYLNVNEEIARVEIPKWVADDEELLNLTHALALDQCRRGQGYPVALAEAHEQAVVTGSDRESFWQFVEMSLTEEKMPTFTSAKSRSKNTRWV